MNRSTDVILEQIDHERVSLIKETSASIDGQSYCLGHYRSVYANSASGRQQLASELPFAYSKLIFKLWDDLAEGSDNLKTVFN